MVVLGITGGTGAGKTSALRVLEKLGAYIIDCDALYHELLDPGQPIYRAIMENFGEEFFTETGALDRKKLGNIVFSDPEELARLNTLIFRHLGAEIENRVEEQKLLDARCVAVDGITIIQARQAGRLHCDCVVGVIAPEEIRLQRIMNRDNISEEYAQKRIDAQEPNSFYLDHCDVIVENTYENQRLFEESVEVFFEDLIQSYEEVKEHG